MPNIKSSIKRVNVASRKHAVNRISKSNLKTALKKYELRNHEGTLDAEILRATTAVVDRAVSKGVLHKNAAARKKSQMQRKLNAQVVK